VFHQSPRSRLEHVLDSGSALWASVEQDQWIEDREKVAVDTGVQRELILAENFPLCGMRKLLLRSPAEPV